MRPTLSASLLLPLLLLASAVAAASAFWPEELERPVEEFGPHMDHGARQLESRLEQLQRTLGRQQLKLQEQLHLQNQHQQRLHFQHQRNQHQQRLHLQHQRNQHQQLLQLQHLRNQHQQKHAPAAAAHDSILVTRDRAGSHVFRLHNGRVVSAQLGASRSYRVHEGIFVSKLCACNGGSGGHRASTCVRRLKPAFYGLLAAGCLLVIALVASIAAIVIKRRRAAASVAASSAVLARRPLLLGGGLSVQCDPVTTGNGVYSHGFQKVSI